MAPSSMLEDRLLFVTTEVAGDCHCDVGTDHALLPLYLLSHKLCRKIIATEKREGPYRVARQALWGREADVRLGDGLTPLEPGEAQSVSLCGMGGSLIVEILEAQPERIPPIVIVQANRDSHKVRRWARRSGYHLKKEQLARGHWLYEVLTFSKAPMSDDDLAYAGIPEELAFHFGPLLLKEKHPLLRADLANRKAHHREHPQNLELQRIKRALSLMQA